MRGELFAAARTAVPLPKLWLQLGLPLKRQGERFATSYTPCCGDSSRDDAGSLFLSRQNEWRWHCFRCKIGGSAVDLLAQHDGITAIQAARKLVGDNGGIEAITGRPAVARRPRTSPVAKRAAVEQVIRTIRNGRTVIDPQVRKYLMDVRGLSNGVIEEAQARGVLRTLPFNPDASDVWLRLNLTEELLKTSGMLTGRRPACAYRPLLFLPPGGTTVEFRWGQVKDEDSGPKAIQYGEQTYPLVWTPTGDVKKILIVEGGIDMLSCVDLGFASNTMILGLLGVSTWRSAWIEPIQARYPNATWQVGVDLGAAGEKAAPLMLESLADAGVSAEQLIPWGGGEDWNDTLLAARAVF